MKTLSFLLLATLLTGVHTDTKPANHPLSKQSKQIVQIKQGQSLKWIFKHAPFIDAQISNMSGTATISFVMEYYDAATGQSFREEQFILHPGESYDFGPDIVNGVDPQYYIGWTTSTTHEYYTYTDPSGYGVAGFQLPSSGSYTYDVVAPGYGDWNFLFCENEPCP